MKFIKTSHSMFCKNVTRLVVARGCYTWIRCLAMAKRAMVLQNILWDSCSKFDFKKCSLKKLFKILIFLRIHGNVLPWQPTVMGNISFYY